MSEDNKDGGLIIGFSLSVSMTPRAVRVSFSLLTEFKTDKNRRGRMRESSAGRNSNSGKEEGKIRDKKRDTARRRKRMETMSILGGC